MDWLKNKIKTAVNGIELNSILPQDLENANDIALSV